MPNPYLPPGTSIEDIDIGSGPRILAETDSRHWCESCGDVLISEYDAICEECLKKEEAHG